MPQKNNFSLEILPLHEKQTKKKSMFVIFQDTESHINSFLSFPVVISLFPYSRMAYTGNTLSVHSRSTLQTNPVRIFHPTETMYNSTRVLCYHSK